MADDTPPPVPPGPGDTTSPPAAEGGYALDGDIFRREALEHHSRPQQEGDLLRLSPSWTVYTFWLLAAVFVAGVAYIIVGNIHEYASGPAVIRIEGKTDLTAKSPGVVASVDVQPGERVTAGQILAHFYVAEETAAYERMNHEFELQLVKVLRDPTNEGARAALTTLRVEKELAEARLSEKAVKAPSDGIVSDIRIHAGEQLNPGEVVFSLVGSDARFQVIAILPGQYRPMLKPGMPLRLELNGYRYAYREILVDTIGDEVVGPTEIRRYLGPEFADTIQVAGPVVLVKAQLPSSSFVVDGKTYNYFDGMQGIAEARVRSESVIVTFVPGLRAIFGDKNGS